MSTPQAVHSARNVFQSTLQRSCTFNWSVIKHLFFRTVQIQTQVLWSVLFLVHIRPVIGAVLISALHTHHSCSRSNIPQRSMGTTWTCQSGSTVVHWNHIDPPDWVHSVHGSQVDPSDWVHRVHWNHVDPVHRSPSEPYGPVRLGHRVCQEV